MDCCCFFVTFRAHCGSAVFQVRVDVENVIVLDVCTYVLCSFFMLM